MKKSHLSLFSSLSLVGASFIACSVDTKDLVFDDDAYDTAKNGTGDGDGDGLGGNGGTNGTGTGDGDGDASGGMGGTMGSGGTTTVEPECTMTGELRCKGKQVQVCGGEFFIDAGKPCEFVCEDGECTGVCEPGVTECISETEQRACDTHGQWGEASACKNVCVDDACGGQCTPGERSCDDTDPSLILLCNSAGKWESASNCSVGVCEDGACSSCSGTETQCTADSKAVQTCESNNWSDPVDCKDQVCLDGACTGECRPALDGDPAQRRCAPGSPSTQVETCGADGTFGNSTSCSFVCVPGSEPGKNDACGGVCKPGARRCDSGKLYACSSDGMKESVVEDCSAEGLSCLDVTGEGDLGCGECTPGLKEPNNRCAQRMVQTCEKGKWVDSQDCSKSIVITKDVYVCYQGACVTGRSACSGSRDSAYGCFDGDHMWGCDSSTATGINSESCLKAGSCTLTSCVTSVIKLPPSP